jgi:hypothetical protein
MTILVEWVVINRCIRDWLMRASSLLRLDTLPYFDLGSLASLPFDKFQISRLSQVPSSVACRLRFRPEPPLNRSPRPEPSQGHAVDVPASLALAGGRQPSVGAGPVDGSAP